MEPEVQVGAHWCCARENPRPGGRRAIDIVPWRIFKIDNSGLRVRLAQYRALEGDQNTTVDADVSICVLIN
jgi:hypothetical protein